MNDPGRSDGHGGATSPDRRAAGQRDTPRVLALKRVSMAGATAFLAINLWTGAPLLAVWVGSQVGSQTTLTMTAAFVVLVVLAALVAAMALALTWLNNTYDELVGRPRAERRTAWLRSMRAEAEGHISQRAGVTLLERIVVTNVYVVVIGFMVWLVFFAGPIEYG
jgi:hypothetical protein